MIMKKKPFIFALSLSLLLLSGCVASVGPEYGYYAPRPYRLHHNGFRYEGHYNRHMGGNRHGGYSRQRHN